MASIRSLDEREDSMMEGQRMSLLDVVEEKNRSMNKKNLLHRMVVISRRHDSTDVNDIGPYYEKFMKHIHNTHQGEGLTGVLLIFPNLCVQVAESCTEMLMALARDLLENEEKENGVMKKSKILIISHDVPTRLYSQWSYRYLDIQAPAVESYDPADTDERLTADVLIQLLKLGAYLQRQPKLNMKNALDSLHEKVPELLPQQEVIHYLLELEEEICISSPKSLIGKHDVPFDCVLASDLVWPIPVRLFPYN